MPDMGAGPRIFKNGTAVATLAFTPLSDRAAVVRRLLIDKVSASDTWIISVSGQEVGRYVINTTGNQQLLSAATGSFPKDTDLFAYCANVLGDPLVYPVANGQTLTVSSVGGATADISIVYEEFTNGAVNSTITNAQGGRTWYAPLYFSLAASQTTTGEKAFDTQAGLSFVPSVFNTSGFQTGWTVDILALFLEGAGVNTYNGSADHQSVTDYIALVKNGQRLFTRDATGGIPLRGTASATGSANTVYGSDYTPYPAFQLSNEQNNIRLDPPLHIGPGDNVQFYLALAGSLTGGASYAGALQVALCRIREG